MSEEDKEGHYNNSTPDEMNKPEVSLALLLAAAHKLGWRTGGFSPYGFTAYMTREGEPEEKVVIFYREEGFSIEGTGPSAETREANVKTLTDEVNRLEGVDIHEWMQKLRQYQHEEAGEPEQEWKWTDYFVPKGGYFVTPLIIWINCIIFIVMVLGGADFFAPSTDTLIAWGGNFKPLTLAGEWWRLITCNFLHFGILHIAMNMYALMYIGMLLEPLLGRARYATAYLLTGIMGSVVSLWWNDFTVSAGASGAIFGMYGVFLAMLTTNLIPKDARRPLLTSIALFVMFNLGIGMKANVDNAGHIGGLLSGLITGYALYFPLRRPQNIKLSHAIVASLTIVFLGIAAGVYATLPNNTGLYLEKENVFAEYEQKGLSATAKVAGSSDIEFVKQMADSSVFYWSAALRVLQEAGPVELPDNLRERLRKLEAYTRLRLDNSRLLVRSIEEDTEIYLHNMEENNEKIGRLLEELGTE